MNIRDAKEQIKNTITAYLTLDEFGNYLIPIERQRPVFLMGAPGIGKTAIMEQIAQELGIALVSYSMTHHTRQSALGLPFIARKDFGGVEYDVSEYTMSEIIASVYESMENTGLKKGILFLDEINCVSETLAPSMLQFLQFKTFGRHRVPDGWVIVTAGNPPEYNKSVQEFDVVTLDRLKYIDIEPNFEVWKEYAYQIGVHPAITTYLDIRKDHFYLVETTIKGKRFVTARGWVDLSQMIQLYEKHGFPVTETLVIQYLQQGRIAKDFAIYYDLFNKYKDDYQVESILNGKASDDIKARAKAAKFDERLALVGLLLDDVSQEMNEVVIEESALRELMQELKIILEKFMSKGANPVSIMGKQIEVLKKKLSLGKQNKTLSTEQARSKNVMIERMQRQQTMLSHQADSDGKTAQLMIREDFNKQSAKLSQEAKKVSQKLSNVFGFLEAVFGKGQEILILVTELTLNNRTARFISLFGNDAYFRHNKDLLFYERQKELIFEIEKLGLSET